MGYSAWATILDWARLGWRLPSSRSSGQWFHSCQCMNDVLLIESLVGAGRYSVPRINAKCRSRWWSKWRCWYSMLVTATYCRLLYAGRYSIPRVNTTWCWYSIPSGYLYAGTPCCYFIPREYTRVDAADTAVDATWCWYLIPIEDPLEISVLNRVFNAGILNGRYFIMVLLSMALTRCQSANSRPIPGGSYSR